MTNYEWILENRKDIVKEALRDKIASSKGEIILCDNLNCGDCDFCSSRRCAEKTMEFLNREHKESSIKIAKDTPLHTPIWVKDNPKDKWQLRFFSGFEKHDIVMTFLYSYYDDEVRIGWNYAKPYVPGVDPEKEEVEND